MKEYKAYIFDLDGTLLDTLEDLADAVNYAMRKNGFPERSLAEVKSFVGDGMRLLVKRSAPTGAEDDLLEKAFADFREYYSVHYMDKTKPYPGIEAMLRALKAQGKRLCVISNKVDYAVKLLMDQFFSGLFETVLGEREGIRRKPSPDSLLAVMEELELSREECVYIGDSDTDIETARNAGIDSISVSWGFRTKEFLKRSGAQRIVDEPKDLLKI
ncbi:MAG: HAD-IA family hydrolase [Firmicutes bacterium]|nr:HAD-IA family hydrolase [Bacillota bacterium]